MYKIEKTKDGFIASNDNEPKLEICPICGNYRRDKNDSFCNECIDKELMKTKFEYFQIFILDKDALHILSKSEVDGVHIDAYNYDDFRNYNILTNPYFAELKELFEVYC